MKFELKKATAFLLWTSQALLVLLISIVDTKIALAESQTFIPGRLIVKYKDSADQTPEDAGSIAAAIQRGKKGTGSSVDRLKAKYQAKRQRSVFRSERDDQAILQAKGVLNRSEIRKQFRESVLASQAKFGTRFKRTKGQAHNAPLSAYNAYVLEIDVSSDILQAVSDFASDPTVEYAQPDYVAYTNLIPNDPGFPSLWGIQKIGAPSAWDRAQGEGIVVGVVDTGVDYNLGDIKNNLWTNPNEIPSNGIDDDNNGFIDDVYGWNFTSTDPEKSKDVMDGQGHGTHVAGTIAATGNNQLGVIGVAPRAKIMAIKSLDDRGGGTMSQLANGVIYAARNGADVISNSWGCQGGCPSNPVVEDAIRVASSLGAVIVFAAGNDSLDVINYSPQNMPEVITVGATNQLDGKAEFSNWGSKIDVSAPGVGILSLKTGGMNGETILLNGTSMAAPHVSGASALILSLHPSWSADQIRTVILQSASDIADAGRDLKTGKGLLNLPAALAVQTPQRVEINSPTVGSTITGSLKIFGTIDLSGSYSLSYKPVGSATESIVARLEFNAPQRNSLLQTWDVSALPAGQYLLTLQDLRSNVRDSIIVGVNAPIPLNPCSSGMTLCHGICLTEPQLEYLCCDSCPAGSSCTRGIHSRAKCQPNQPPPDLCPEGQSTCNGVCINNLSLVYLCCGGCEEGSTCVSRPGGATCERSYQPTPIPQVTVAACSPGQSMCNGSCVNDLSLVHLCCGGCAEGTTCVSHPEGAQCEPIAPLGCPAGQAMCGGSCVAESTLNFICCGGCADGTTCVSHSGGATCEPVEPVGCPSGQSMCGGSCVSDVSLNFICCGGCDEGSSCVSHSGGATCEPLSPTPDPNSEPSGDPIDNQPGDNGDAGDTGGDGGDEEETSPDPGSETEEAQNGDTGNTEPNDTGDNETEDNGDAGTPESGQPEEDAEAGPDQGETESGESEPANEGQGEEEAAGEEEAVASEPSPEPESEPSSEPESEPAAEPSQDYESEAGSVEDQPAIEE